MHPEAADSPVSYAPGSAAHDPRADPPGAHPAAGPGLAVPGAASPPRRRARGLSAPLALPAGFAALLITGAFARARTAACRAPGCSGWPPRSSSLPPRLSEPVVARSSASSAG